jgi:hypothetical protein
MAQSTGTSHQEHLHRLAAWEQPVTLRLAGVTDGAALDRLAQLDSRPLPPGPILLGERNGWIQAAISLATGELIADPFRRTAELCELLRCHAGELRVRPERSPTAPLRLRPRLVTA